MTIEQSGYINGKKVPFSTSEVKPRTSIVLDIDFRGGVMVGTVPGIFDTHLDGTNREVLFKKPLTQRHKTGRVLEVKGGKIDNVDNVSFPGMKEGGYIGAFANAFPGVVTKEGTLRPPTHEEFWDDYRKHTSVYERAAARKPGEISIVTSRDALDEALASGKMAWVKSIEGLYIPPTNEGLTTLNQLIADGITNFGIMWNFENAIGRPHLAELENDDTGLSSFGVDVVQQLAEMPGALIDISHSSTKTAYDILKHAREGQVIATHAGSRNINPHTRNLTPDIAAEVGRLGVIGVPFVASFMKDSENTNQVSAKDVVRHMLDLKRILGGSEHLALGTDFGGIGGSSSIPGLNDVASAGDVLYDEMTKSREFSPQEIEGIFGKNVVRHLQESFS